MTTLINIGNRTSTFAILQSDVQVTLAKNDIVDVQAGNGIVQNAGFGTATIDIDGEVHAADGSGLRLSGHDNIVTAGFDSIITGAIGIWFAGTTDMPAGGNRLVAKGQIAADADGIRNEMAATAVFNLGSLEADRAILGVNYGLTITNGTFGTIHGRNVAVDLSGIASDQRSTIVNDGTIAGPVAIIGSAEVEKVVNHGTIKGAVRLGAGEDIFDGRGGQVQGAVRGGADNDTYFVSSADIVLLEQANGGTYDTVNSTANYRLGTNFEILRLLGRAAINGSGNELGNLVIGNGAANVLRGGGGADDIRGGGGADILFGGFGADIFAFGLGDGNDTIRDFTPSGAEHDRIHFVDDQLFAGFDDLIHHHVRQRGQDLVIDDGRGDHVTLLHTEIADLRPSDFLFGAA